MKVLFKYEKIGKKPDYTRLKWIMGVGFLIAVSAVVFRTLVLMIPAVLIVNYVLIARAKAAADSITTSFIATDLGLEIYQGNTDDIGDPLVLGYEDIFIGYFLDKQCTEFYLSFYASEDDKTSVSFYVPQRSELQRFLLTDAKELFNVRLNKAHKKLGRKHTM